MLIPLISLAAAQSEQFAAISSTPPLTPDEVARLEVKVQANPEDLGTRLRLLANYRDNSSRMPHIRYLVERHPELPASASALTYVMKAAGADHALLQALWTRQAARHSGDAAVVLNAARFLFVEHKDEAEDLLRHAVEANPSSPALAANLGFLYALEVLGMDSMWGVSGPFSLDERSALAARASAALDASANPWVLAGAATAIPNLAMRASLGRPVNEEFFHDAAKWMAKARQLAPADPELRGPMPMIRYFEQAAKQN